MIKIYNHSGIHCLHSRQTVPAKLQQAWVFFADPANLGRITPAYMNFNITSPFTERMYAGQIITYHLSPLPGLTINWVTEITQVNEPYYFIDEQRKGPYNFWHHIHRFHTVDNGTEIEDIVYYKLPFGILGNIGNALFVKRQLHTIFSYRAKTISKLSELQ